MNPLDCAALFKSVRLIAFDLDGTLVNAFEDIAVATNTMLDALGMERRPTDEIKKHVGRGPRALIAGVLDLPEDDPIVERGYPILYDYYLAHPSDLAHVYPDVIELLTELHKRGIFLSVTSNKPHPMTVATLETTGLIGHFDWVQGSDERFRKKPSPEILHYLMSEFAIPAEDCLVIGDTQYDIEFARNARVKVAVVTHGQSTRDELAAHNPDMIVDSFSELLRMVRTTP